MKLVALVLALVGLLLTVATDVRDESGELFDLRAQGATPGELRRYLRVRAALVAIAGVAGGLVAGAILVTLVSAVVAVTAGATTPLPPLVVPPLPSFASNSLSFELSKSRNTSFTAVAIVLAREYLILIGCVTRSIAVSSAAG